MKAIAIIFLLLFAIAFNSKHRDNYTGSNTELKMNQIKSYATKLRKRLRATAFTVARLEEQKLYGKQ